jgi:hypothetical protein
LFSSRSPSGQSDESELLIGKGDPNYSFGEYFDGEVDEIRIWSDPELYEHAVDGEGTWARGLLDFR